VRSRNSHDFRGRMPSFVALCRGRCPHSAVTARRSGIAGTRECARNIAGRDGCRNESTGTVPYCFRSASHSSPLDVAVRNLARRAPQVIERRHLPCFRIALHAEKEYAQIIGRRPGGREPRPSSAPTWPSVGLAWDLVLQFPEGNRWRFGSVRGPLGGTLIKSVSDSRPGGTRVTPPDSARRIPPPVACLPFPDSAGSR
jgi:hypothetical protein